MDIFGELLYLLTLQKNQIVVLSKFKSFLKRKDIEVSFRRYGLGAMSAASSTLACSSGKL